MTASDRIILSLAWANFLLGLQVFSSLSPWVSSRCSRHWVQTQRSHGDGLWTLSLTHIGFFWFGYWC